MVCWCLAWKAYIPASRNLPVALLTGLLVLFRYLANSGDALLGGVLPLRYRAASFALRVLTWRLPLWRNVAGLSTEEGEEVGLVHVAPYTGIDADVDIASGGAGDNRTGGPGGFWKRVRPSRKTPAHLVCQDGLGRQSRLPLVLMVKRRGGVCFSMMRAFQLSMTGWEFAERHWGTHTPASPGLLLISNWDGLHMNTHLTVSETTTNLQSGEDPS